jgi:hypothetical protein
VTPEPQRGPAIGELLSSGSAAPRVGGVINLAEVAGEEDGKVSKCETLSDLRAKYPEIQRDGSGWKMVVERIRPKVLNGMKVDGVVGEFCSQHDGKDLASIDGFRDMFGAGDYEVWVIGPSQNSVDPTTGRPKIIRKDGIKHSVPDKPMTQQNFMPPINPYGPSVHPSVEIARINAEAKREDVLLQRALEGSKGDPASSQLLDLVKQQLADSNARNAELERIVREGNNRRDPMAERLVERTLDSDRERVDQLRAMHTEEVNRMRSHYEGEIERIRGSYTGEIERIRSAFEDRIERINSSNRESELRIRQDFESRVERLNREVSQLQEKTRGEEREIRAREQERFDAALRLERESFNQRTESMKADAQRAMDSAKADYQRSLEMLRADRERDLESLERQQTVLLEAKNAEINSLRAENDRLSTKVTMLEAQVNKPFEDKIKEVAQFSELLGLGGGGATEEKEEKTDIMESVVRFAETPAGGMIATLVASGVAEKLGIKMPAAPPPQPPPKQMTQGQPQRGQAKKTRPSPAPQQAAQPPQQPQQQEAQAPAPQQHPPMPPVHVRGQQPMPDEVMRTVLPILEQSFREAATSNPQAEPKDFASKIREKTESLAPGQDMVSSFAKWIDGENFCKLMFRVAGGSFPWGAYESWVRAVWEEMEKFQPKEAAPIAEPSA